MKTLSIVFLLLFIFTGGFFYWQKNNARNQVGTITELPKKIFINTIETNDSSGNKIVNSNEDMQVSYGNTQIVINPNNNQEEVKISIPKGKILYDEEKMKEISSDANIETIRR